MVQTKRLFPLGCNRGFTLVELLVVISIIALLLGVLLPVLSKAREQGRAIVCATNLKNYNPALLMYAQDNSDKCPFSFYWLYSKETLKNETLDTEGCRWHKDTDPPDGLLWPYLKSISVHMCPTFKGFAMSRGLNGCPNRANHKSLKGGGAMPFNPRYSYSMNRWIGLYEPKIYYTEVGSPEYEALMAPMPSLKLSRVKRTSKCFAFSEENLWTIDIPHDRTSEDPDLHHKYRKGDSVEYSGSSLAKTDFWIYMLTWDNGDMQANLATYHGVSANNCDEGKANVVFVDGHVARIRGLAGYDAYLEYGKPFDGHEKTNDGQIW